MEILEPLVSVCTESECTLFHCWFWGGFGIGDLCVRMCDCHSSEEQSLSQLMWVLICGKTWSGNHHVGWQTRIPFVVLLYL